MLHFKVDIRQPTHETPRSARVRLHRAVSYNSSLGSPRHKASHFISELCRLVRESPRHLSGTLTLHLWIRLAMNHAPAHSLASKDPGGSARVSTPQSGLGP